MTFNSKPRADITVVEGDHDIYREWEIPGYRDSDYYDGSGVVETYNLAPTERDYPPNEDACPELATVKVGNVKQDILRKNVDHLTIRCPECDVDGRKSESGESFCPECGLLLSRTDAEHKDYHLSMGVQGQVISRRAEDAGRYDEKET